MNDDTTNSEYNRRDFLKGGSFAALATLMGGVRLVAQTNLTENPVNAPISKTKVAVIGLGMWGREILDQLARLPHADIVAICDHYGPFLRRAARKVPNAAQTEDYKTILANKDVKAVIIATPTHLHKEIALEAMAGGKHIYCEAPLACAIEDAKEIALAAKKNARVLFQPGLQMRADPQEAFLLKFARSGALGKWLMACAQWNKKTSWRAASPNPEREKEMNWRLAKETSLGIVGELGIHEIDRATRYFGALPTAITGFGTIAFYQDGREVADTVQAIIEYPEGVRLIYHATLANSFEADNAAFYGSDAAVMIRGGSAWMFKETDAPLLGWEVYAKKDNFLQETGVSLRMDASKLKQRGNDATQKVEVPDPPLYFALQNFLRNASEVGSAVEDFISLYGESDVAALKEHVTQNAHLEPAPDYLDGYQATVIGIKAHESITSGKPVALKPDLFELA